MIKAFITYDPSRIQKITKCIHLFLGPSSALPEMSLKSFRNFLSYFVRSQTNTCCLITSSVGVTEAALFYSKKSKKAKKLKSVLWKSDGTGTGFGFVLSNFHKIHLIFFYESLTDKTPNSPSHTEIRDSFSSDAIKMKIFGILSLPHWPHWHINYWDSFCLISCQCFSFRVVIYRVHTVWVTLL